VSEFAKELLVSQEYFSHDPNYWVSSGLVNSTESRDALFAATQSACDPRTGLSSQAAVMPHKLLGQLSDILNLK